MTWFRDFGLFEGVLVLLFLGAYIAYILKVVRIAKRLNTPTATSSTSWSSLPVVCVVAGGLPRPSFGDSRKEVKSVGKDIMICVNAVQIHGRLRHPAQPPGESEV